MDVALGIGSDPSTLYLEITDLHTYRYTWHPLNIATRPGAISQEDAAMRIRLKKMAHIIGRSHSSSRKCKYYFSCPDGPGMGYRWEGRVPGCSGSGQVWQHSSGEHPGNLYGYYSQQVMYSRLARHLTGDQITCQRSEDPACQYCDGFIKAAAATCQPLVAPCCDLCTFLSQMIYVPKPEFNIAPIHRALTQVCMVKVGLHSRSIPEPICVSPPLNKETYCR